MCSENYDNNNNIARVNSVRTISRNYAVALLATLLIVFCLFSNKQKSYAEELKSAAASMADSLYFDTNLGSAISEHSLENTPRYLWVSDKLSLSNNTEKTSDRSSIASGAEYWSKNKWGISSGFSSNNESLLLGVPKNSELFNVDVNRQLLRSKNKKDYLAVGFGWQSVNVGDTLDANGLRVSLLGKYNLADHLQVYGASSWFPENLGLGSSASDLSGYNLEAGLVFKPKGRLSLQAGFRFYDFEGKSSASDVGSSIFTLGTKLSF